MAGTINNRRWRSLLIVLEFALTCLLLTGSSLMLRTLSKLYEADLGYTTEHILTFDMELAGSDYKQSSARLPVIEQALERIAALRGVKHVAMVNPLPLRGGNQSLYYVEGNPVLGPGKTPSAERAQVSSDYFETMSIPLLSGRTFGVQDQPNSPRVAIVDVSFAQQYFAGKDPIGKRFVYGEKPPAKDSDWVQIVGVVGHIKNFGIRASSREQTYLPVSQSVPQSVSFAVRTDLDPTGLAQELRSIMHELTPDQPIFGFRTMEERFESSISNEKLTVVLLGVFSGIALLLAAVGLYGVLNYVVGQRTREIGVRMALGATPGSVLKLVLQQGLGLAGLGLVLGLVGAVCLTQVLQGMLFGVSPFDPVSFGVVAFVLLVIGIIACVLPARYATSIDPIKALRAD